MTHRISVLCLFLSLALAQTTAAGSATLHLAWDPNPETNLAGYRLHYGTSSGAYTASVDVGNVTSYTVHGLAADRQYFIAVQAYNTAGQFSPISSEVSGFTQTTAEILSGANLLLGLGPHSGEGGWFSVRAGAERAFGPTTWGRVPWDAYNAAGGGVRLAAGDLDGDGASEIVVGLGPGSNGWVAILDDAANGHAVLAWVQVPWAAYNAANGEVFPAVGDLDGDGRAEIVLGLGTGSHGWYLILDDAMTGFKPLAWRQVSWPAYNTGAAVTHPAVGDLDGDGYAEIVLGLGQGSNGRLEVVSGALQDYSHRNWLEIDWASYAAANGTTFPAVGDLDGDGRAEVVIGLGHGSAGWFLILDDAQTGFAPLAWGQLSWDNYNAHSGESRPAIGNIDGDPAMEIVFGLADYADHGGWFEVFDDAATGFARRGWYNVDYPAFTANGGGLFPAIASRR